MYAKMSESAFLVYVRFYLKILLGLLAAAGFLCLVGLQAGWIIPANGVAIKAALSEEEGKEVDADFLSFTGPGSVWSQPILVDTSLVYEISAEVRTFSLDEDPYREARTYLGVATFDENMEPIRSGPGTHRYAGAANRIVQMPHGWLALGGSITGEGDERHDQFRPGTRFVRVVALLNYRSEGVRSEIRNIRFTPRLILEKQ